MIDVPSDLKTFLMTEEQRSLDESLNAERAVAIDFYNGAPFGDEEEGRSQLVTRDVAEVIDYMVVSILRTIVSGNRVVEFEARSPDQQQAAEDATELVQWQFMREQPGYQILHDILKAGLLEKSGVAKTWAEPTFEMVEDIATAEQVDADETIVSAEPIADGVDVVVDPLTGLEVAVQLYAVRRKVPGPVLFRDAAVPNEEFRVSPEARTLDEAVYIQHRTRKTLAWLLEQDWGLTEEDTASLWSSATDALQLSTARDGSRSRGDDPSTGLSRQVWLSEEHIRWDWNGDGEAERLCIYRVGDHVLAIEEREDQPFVLWTPFPMQHRLIGQSLADKTMDIQRVRSILLRQSMDALYFATSPRLAINTDVLDPHTLDDAMEAIPGAPIRYRGEKMPMPITMPFAAPHAFQALEFMAGERESRTGITRLNQGLDADALNKTATGTAMMQAQGQQIEEYLARNFAELVAELFEKKLRLMQRYGSPVSLRVGGEFKDIDPGTITGRMDMAITVGLGSGRKDQRLVHRMNVLEMQKEAIANGMSLADEENLYNSAKGYIEDAGLGNVNAYFRDPATTPQMPEGEEPPPPQVQAKMLEIEARREQQQADLAYKSQAKQLDMELKVWERQLEIELAAAKTAEEAQIARERIVAEMEMHMQSIAAKMASDNAPPRFRDGGSLAV